MQIRRHAAAEAGDEEDVSANGVGNLDAYRGDPETLLASKQSEQDWARFRDGAIEEPERFVGRFMKSIMCATLYTGVDGESANDAW